MIASVSSNFVKKTNEMYERFDRLFSSHDSPLELGTSRSPRGLRAFHYFLLASRQLHYIMARKSDMVHVSSTGAMTY